MRMICLRCFEGASSQLLARVGLFVMAGSDGPFGSYRLACLVLWEFCSELLGWLHAWSRGAWMGFRVFGLPFRFGVHDTPGQLLIALQGVLLLFLALVKESFKERCT